MAVFELAYQRLAGPRRRPAAPALAIALAELRLLQGRRAVRLTVGAVLFYTLTLVATVVLRSGILEDQLQGLLPSRVLPPIDARFFEGAVTNRLHHLLVLLLALFAGSGRIADDLRSNALAIYLAKPLTRADYLLGKVAATAAVIALGALACPFLAYLVAALADPAFLGANLRSGAALLAHGLASTLYHAAAALFFSAMVRSGRLAGVLLGALYFLSQAVKEVTGAALRTQATAFLGFRTNLDTLAAHLFGRAGADTPALAPAALVILAVVLLGLGFARRRVRAVEVVR